ncbi:MAG: hypothetical protein ACI3YC_07310 [Alloprevotella sp.]
MNVKHRKPYSSPQSISLRFVPSALLALSPGPGLKDEVSEEDQLSSHRSEDSWGGAHDNSSFWESH